MRKKIDYTKKFFKGSLCQPGYTTQGESNTVVPTTKAFVSSTKTYFFLKIKYECKIKICKSLVLQCVSFVFWTKFESAMSR